ncbi:MAG: hypothetical protein JSW45_01955 [Thiotrichales bacterium]|nr:MAG: hypothetical protein JSW45_01955 [Thiotrichales bacterium]
MELQSFFRYAVLACSITTLAACSSSGSDAPATTTISGSIFASHVDGATVTVKDTSGNDIAGPVTTGHDGFTVSIPDADLASTLVFESTGGTFDDEATGASTDAGAMSVMVAGGSLSSTSNSVHATPGSKIINELVTVHGMTMTDAEAAFNSAFGYTPDHGIAPTDATSPAAGAENDQLLAGLRAAAFSQLTSDLGLPADQQFNLLSALALDLSDNTLDGQAASGAVSVGGTAIPEDIQNKFSTALLNFHGSANDNTGLNDAQIGVVPFAKVVLTASYRIEYSSMMMEMQGKSAFNLTITNLSDGSAATGLTLALSPMMHMADRMHSTPYVDFVETSPGTYTATAYYLMPSVMMTGDTMGYWHLMVDIDSTEMANLYPTVMMAMADNTQRVQLKGITDTIVDMNMLTVPRPYNLFRDGLTETGGGTNYQFDIFIAPMEDMLNFPALLDPMTLNSGMGAPTYDVNNVTVDVNVNDGGWQNDHGVDNTDGTWSLNGLSLTSGANQIKVRLTVSGETKTTDGLAVNAGVNDFTTFIVTLP